MNLRSALLLASLTASVAILGSCSSDDDPPPTFTIGGTASGVTGTGLVLQLNGGAGLPVPADGGFTFPERLLNGAAYDVEIVSSSAGETCTVSMGSGTVAGTDVTSVVVTCSPTSFTVGGTISGFDTIPSPPPAFPMSGDLVLRLNGGEEVRVA